LLLSCGLLSNPLYANEPGNGFRVESIDYVPSGTNDLILHKHHLTALPDDAKDTDDPADPNVPEDPEDTDSREEKEDTVDDVWNTVYKFSVRSQLCVEKSLLLALTKSLQNRKVLPLFLLHRSWKSFLS
jgi:hypothetical protein